jgi:cation diffusion facilitator CzcD-associated flavoprotein CzcO
MKHLPSGLADALGAPLVRFSIGDITEVGLRKLPYGPNMQIKQDRQIPLLDIGTMSLIREGRIGVHGDIARFTRDGVVFEDGTALAVDAVVLATGYRPGLSDFLPAWSQVCDSEGRPLVSGGRTSLPGLFFCGMFVSPSGMLREAGREAQRLAGIIAGS